jgi:hypothetical protein
MVDMLLNIIIFLLLSLGLFCGIALFYSLRRINQYENFILNIQNIISSSTKRMKQVDSTGHYESDDETGFFFEQLKQIQLMLDDLFEPTEGDGDAEKKEK